MSPLRTWLPVLSLLAACGPLPPASPGPGPGPVDAGAGFDTTPIEAPAETWSYVALPESRCANGSSTGVAVNFVPGSRELLVYLQGGGACWEDFACLYGLDGNGTATHLKDVVGESVVLAEARLPNVLLDRGSASNPFARANLVYVPYCTGDLHAGNAVHDYKDAFGQTVSIHHEGGHNLDVLLARLRGTFPSLERIWLAGASAGGYGATLNWWRLREAFPGVRVDVLDDSGPLVDPAGGQFGTMRAAWAMQLPPGCEECKSSLGAVLPFYGRTVPAPARYALLAFREDEVIRAYFGFGLDATSYRTQVDALVAGMSERQRAFRLDGTGHVLLALDPLPSTSTGVSLGTWLQEFATDAPAWSHAGP